MTKHRVYRDPVVQPQDQSIRFIPLTRSQVATVDTSDYEWLNQWNWIARWSKTSKSFYAERTHGGPAMHNVILGIARGGDHWSHQTLDNRRINLRITDHSKQMMNRRVFSNNKSGHPGVAWHSRDNKWGVFINVNGKRVSLGNFPPDQKAQAIAVRKEAEKKYHGEFAYGTHQSSLP